MSREDTAAPATATGGVASVGVASLVAAVTGYLVLVVAARTLTPEENADFLVFWSLLFGAFGVLGGLQQESTRATAARRLAGDVHGTARTLPLGLALGAGLAVVLAATSPLWGPDVVGPGGGPGVLALTLGVVAYAGYASLVGNLSGDLAWLTSSRLIALEALTRAACVGLAALLVGTTLSLEVASTLGAGAWLVFLLVSRRARGAARARGDAAPRTFASHALRSMVAAAASAALVVGFPVLLRASSTPEAWATSAPLVLAISMTRAPIMMPLIAYQGVAITYFLAHRDRGWAALARIAAVLAGVGAVGAVLAALVGPPLMAAFFGPDYRVPGTLLAALLAGATSLALLTLTGSVALALSRHTAYAVGWFAALAASVALLLLPVPLETRAALSLAVGPLVGITVHLASIRGALRTAV